MQVIDGMHRLKAAIDKGLTVISVRYFDGTDVECFITAVQANIAHGLPLSLADRRAAAARILRSCPHWSDRAIAAVTGLAPKTVATLRRRDGVSTGNEIAARVGRDGKVRPTDGSAGRRVASELITNSPQLSLREVAARAGISRATARDVRRRLSHGENPLVGPAATGPMSPAEAGPEVVGSEAVLTAAHGPAALRRNIIENLARDPSLRFTEHGRALLRWLTSQSFGVQNWTDFVDAVPPHCSYRLVDLARDCADEWLMFAAELERRTRQMA